MFRRTLGHPTSFSRKLYSKSSPSASGFRFGIRSPTGAIIAGSGVLVVYVLWCAKTQKIRNDTSPKAGSTLRSESPLPAGGDVGESEELRTVVWGSNRSKTLMPDPVDVIRTPSIAKWLDGVALRDLVFHKNHAACIDARGDVYQWGNGFLDSASGKKNGPVLTLRGKNIVQLKHTEGRLYALSASGKVYALAAEASKQEVRAGTPTPSSDSWWGTGWLWGEDETVDFVEITPTEPLSWGEKITSIEAGNDHVLALTSKRRTYAHPINKKANAYGQLGFRRFRIPEPAVRLSKTGYLDVELVPKSLSDPFAKSNRATRPSLPALFSENLTNIDDTSLKFCPHFYEIPVLKGIEIAQIAAGGRTSFVRTQDGRVLGWGANEYGQIGLGDNIAMDTVTVPTEVVLWKSSGGRSDTRCIDITAGGNLTAFTVERESSSSGTTIDLLMCGNGQWGGLGSNVFTNVQGAPVRAKNVSGLVEYSEQTKRLQPIAPHTVTVSPTGHILLTLNTSSTTDVGGRDLVVWGKNYESELGNGKKSSVPVPTNLETAEGGRFMLRSRKAREVRDLHGRIWKRGVKVEQRAAVGFENSAVYWKIC